MTTKKKTTRKKTTRKNLTTKDPVMFRRIGASGLQEYGGYIREEFHPHLRGTRAAKVYREMADNHPLIGAFNHLIETLLGQVSWTAEASGETPEHVDAADFCDSAIHDLARPFSSFVSEALTLTTFGFSVFEKVFKLRKGSGYPDSEVFTSKHNDSRIGWYDFEIRAQESIVRWVTDSAGRAIAFEQITPQQTGTQTIPLSKCIHFRWRSQKNNPEGRSMFRNAYTSYYHQKHLEFTEGVGATRNLAGLPVARVPVEILSDANLSTELAEYEKLVRRITTDEQQGLVFPARETTDGSPTGYDFELLTGGGNKPADLDPVIRRYASYILVSLLSEVLLLGTDKVGSYSLSSDKTDLLVLSLKTILKVIVDQFEDHAFPELLRVNGIDPALAPRLSHSDIEAPEFVSFVTAVSQGFLNGLLGSWSETDTAHVRELLGLPEEQRGGLLPSEQPETENGNQEAETLDLFGSALERYDARKEDDKA